MCAEGDSRDSLQIRSATSAKDIEQVRVLMREFAASLDFDLAFQDFEDEVANLPGRYAPPNGCLLVAVKGNRYLGCVALRRLSSSDCEMKRLFVRPAARGEHVGRRLTGALIDAAQSMGFRRMLLDTVASMVAAIHLYESLGFIEAEPYTHNPLEGARFLQLRLATDQREC